MALGIFAVFLLSWEFSFFFSSLKKWKKTTPKTQWTGHHGKAGGKKERSSSSGQQAPDKSCETSYSLGGLFWKKVQFSSDIFHALRSEIIVSVCSLHKQTIRLKHCNISENLIFLYSWVCPLQQYSLYRGPSVKHNMTLLTEHYYRVIKKCHISKKNSAPAHVSLIFC